MIANIPLDEDTPCGLFETNRGERMLVTMNEDVKVAIILYHHTLLSFTWQRLTKKPLATGDWLGDFEVELVHRFRGRSGTYPLGTLGIMERSLHLDCHIGDGDHGDGYPGGIHIGDIDYSDPLTDYDGWRILKDNRVFFEKLPRVANWPKVLSVRAIAPP